MREKRLSIRIVALAAAYALALQGMLVPAAIGYGSGAVAVSVLCSGKLADPAGAPIADDGSCCFSLGCHQLGGPAPDYNGTVRIPRPAFAATSPTAPKLGTYVDRDGWPQKSRAPPAVVVEA